MYGVSLITPYFLKHIFYSDDAIHARQNGQEQLEMIRRQRIIGNLYPSHASVMESNSN